MTFSKGWLKSPLLKASENEASNAQPNRVLAPSKVKGISKKRQPDKASLEGQMVKDMSGGEKGRRVSKSGVNGRGKKQGGDNIAQDQSDRGSQAGKAKRGWRGGSAEVVELDEDLARNREDPVHMVEAPMPTCSALLVSSMRNARCLARC